MSSSSTIDWEIIDDMSKLMFLIYDYTDKWKLQNKSLSILDTFITQNQNLVSDKDITLLNGLKEKYPRGELLDFYSNSSDAQCFIGTNPIKKRLCIVFRGTDSFTDCLYDLFIIKKNLGNGIKVHRGFYNQLHYDNLYQKVMDGVRKQIKQHPDWSVCITGHSLGGALSTLSSYLLAKEFPDVKFVVYAFASPKVGNKKFKSEYNSLGNLYNCRICYNKDCVTAFPTFWYEHIGHNLWYEKQSETWHFYDKSIHTNFYLCYYYNAFDHSTQNYMSIVAQTYQSICKDGLCNNLITYC